MLEVGDLLGLRTGRMREDFQMWGRLAWERERLKREVRKVMPRGPRCFRCRLVIPSGPRADKFLTDLIASTVSLFVNGLYDGSSFRF